jgi:hypothetical protein
MIKTYMPPNVQAIMIQKEDPENKSTAVSITRDNSKKALLPKLQSLHCTSSAPSEYGEKQHEEGS